MDINDFWRILERLWKRLWKYKWDILFSILITSSIFVNFIAMGFRVEYSREIYNEFKYSADEEIRNYIEPFKNYVDTIFEKSKGYTLGLNWWIVFSIVHLLALKLFYYYPSSARRILTLFISTLMYILFFLIGVYANKHFMLVEVGAINHTEKMFFICHAIIFGVSTVAYLNVIQNDLNFLKTDRERPNELPTAVNSFLDLEYKKSIAFVNVLGISLITLSTAYVIFVLKDVYIPFEIKVNRMHSVLDTVFLVRFFHICLTYAFGIMAPYMARIGQITKYLRSQASVRMH